MVKVILTILSVAICSCAVFTSDSPRRVSKKSKLENLPKNYPPNFTTGIVIAIERPGPLIRNPMEVIVKNQRTGEILRVHAQWDKQTGIALQPSEYSVRTYVPYLGKDIWETKKEAVIDSSMVASLTFTFPTLVTSPASSRLSPYRANKKSRIQSDTAEAK